MKYRPEIDGLRAIAVISVILYHLGFSYFKGGYIGVDIFFVISGFLITSIITREIDNGEFTILNFYERRARRILPALMFILLLTAVSSWLLLPPNEFIKYTKSLFSVVLFGSNIFFWRDGEYFITDASLKPLLHTWSIAVEEQFYLFFPVFLLLLKNAKQNLIFKIILALCILSLSLSQYSSIEFPVANFYLLPTRFWELGLGALTSILVTRNKLKISALKMKLMPWTGLALIAYSTLFFDAATPFPSLYTLIPTTGAAIIIIYASSESGIGKLLANKSIVFLGLISYSAYLIHQPLIAFQKIYFGTNESSILKALTLLTIFILAFLNYRFVESPFRNRNLFSKKSIAKFSIYTSAIMLIYSVYVFKIMPFHFEEYLAKKLSKTDVIYATNMDDRIFVKSRISHENNEYNSLVLGSSRVMQISKKLLGENLINLAVMGASVEDDIAIGTLATKKFKPKKIYISADPWLFNLNSDQNRWKSLTNEYIIGLSLISNFSARDSLNIKSEIPLNISSKSLNLLNIYMRVNLSNFTKFDKLDEDAGLDDKIRKDGSRVYNSRYANMTESEINKSIENQLYYSIQNFKFSETSYKNFIKLIQYFQRKKIKVVLVLPPYHPKLIDKLFENKFQIMEIEKKIIEMASLLNIQILGSYDPRKCGCNTIDFYDGMHPKEACINSIILKGNKVESIN
jgi:peptidoglycan/LPS O-acetylase OafA/YrhL